MATIQGRAKSMGEYQRKPTTMVAIPATSTDHRLTFIKVMTSSPQAKFRRAIVFRVFHVAK